MIKKNIKSVTYLRKINAVGSLQQILLFQLRALLLQLLWWKYPSFLLIYSWQALQWSMLLEQNFF